MATCRNPFTSTITLVDPLFPLLLLTLIKSRFQAKPATLLIPIKFWGGAPQGVVPLTFIPLAESPR